MPMSEEMTVFKKNYSEWQDTHPTRSSDRWVATTDRKKAAKFISEQAEKIAKSQREAADDIIISQREMKGELEEISRGVKDIANGVAELKATFEWGFSELIWQIEKQRETLQEILETLQKPLGTQAKELKERAEEAYKNGWIDDALRDFLESEEKNKYDFTIHQSLGNIYFFHKGKPEKALEYYKKAVKYAKPESEYHASLACIHVALVRYLQEDYEAAKEATAQAIDLTPDLDFAHYEHARYLAKLGDFNGAISHLGKAIKADRLYALKANMEEDFDGMEDEFKSFIRQIRSPVKKATSQEITKARKYINVGEKVGASVDGYDEELNRLKKLVGKDSLGLFDCQDALNKAREIHKAALKALDETINQLSRKINDLKEDTKKTEEKYSRKKEEANEGHRKGPRKNKLRRREGAVGLVILGVIGILTASGSISGGAELFGAFVYGFLALALATVLIEGFNWYKYKRKLEKDHQEEIKQKRERISNLKTTLQEALNRKS